MSDFGINSVSDLPGGSGGLDPLASLFDPPASSSWSTPEGVGWTPSHLSPTCIFTFRPFLSYGPISLRIPLPKFLPLRSPKPSCYLLSNLFRVTNSLTLLPSRIHRRSRPIKLG